MPPHGGRVKETTGIARIMDGARSGRIRRREQELSSNCRPTEGTMPLLSETQPPSRRRRWPIALAATFLMLLLLVGSVLAVLAMMPYNRPFLHQMGGHGVYVSRLQEPLGGGPLPWPRFSRGLNWAGGSGQYIVLSSRHLHEVKLRYVTDTECYRRLVVVGLPAESPVNAPSPIFTPPAVPHPYGSPQRPRESLSSLDDPVRYVSHTISGYCQRPASSDTPNSPPPIHR